MYRNGFNKKRFLNKRGKIILLILILVIGILLIRNTLFSKNIDDLISLSSANVSEPVLKSNLENSQPDQSINNAIINKNITIILDAGHGGVDGGTDVDGVLEKDINLDITLRLGKLLKDIGVNILYTRETDEYISLKNRIQIINTLNADFLISIHNNSFIEDTKINGTSTLYYTNKNESDTRLDSKKLAEIVQTELVGKLKTRDAGAILRSNLGILKLVKIPSIISEIAFLTNPTDRGNLMREEFRQNTAEAIATAVEKVVAQM